MPELFLDALFIAFQSKKGRAGFAYDLRWFAGLCHATWREEALWNGMVHVKRGNMKFTHLMYAAQRDVERVRWLLARALFIWAQVMATSMLSAAVSALLMAGADAALVDEQSHRA